MVTAADAVVDTAQASSIAGRRLGIDQVPSRRIAWMVMYLSYRLPMFRPELNPPRTCFE